MSSIEIRYNDVDRQRLTWLDIARGIGIILVVLGHSVTTVIRENSAAAMQIYNAVYFFHMPLLFFISGTAFELKADKYRKTKVLSYIADKAKRLMIPYVLYSFLIYLCFFAANLIPALAGKLEPIGYGKVSFLDWLYQMITGENLYTQHLWYIYALFIISVIVFLTVKISGKFHRIIACVCAVCFIVILYYSNLLPGGFLWKTVYSAIWFMLGATVGINREMKDPLKIIAILAVPAMLYLRMKTKSLANGVFDAPVRILTILAIIFGVIALSQFLSRLRLKIFEWLGKNSFPIYLFHQPLFGSGLGVVLYGIFKLPVAFCIIVSFAASIVIPALIGIFIEKKDLKIGKIFIGKTSSR